MNTDLNISHLSTDKDSTSVNCKEKKLPSHFLMTHCVIGDA